MREAHSRNRSRKAQHLIEFAIVIPILMLLVFVIVEVGMAINARMALSEAVKAALVEVNNLNTLGGTDLVNAGTNAANDTVSKIDKVENYIGSQVTAYLIQHNIPNSGSINVNVSVNDNHATVLVSYEYNPVFVLPGMGKIIPDTYHFSSSQTLNPHIFKSNVFPASSSTLYRTTADLSLYHQDSFDDYNNAGELVSSAARPYTAFLIHMYDLYPNFEDYNYARLISWEGYDLLPPNLRINLKLGTLEVRSPYYVTDMLHPWVNTRIPYVWAASALGINHLIYVKHNTDRIKILDTAGLYYKLRLNDTNSFYNLDIPNCSQTSTCNGNLIGTNTINERALRFNPRIGSGLPWNDAYIIGTTEPVKINASPSMTPHPFQQINSLYFSYTDDYFSWSNVNWQKKYLITISTPFVRGLDLTNPMPDAIYNKNISDNTISPFFKPFEYRLRLCESNPEGASCAPGTYLGPAAIDGSQDGNIDANHLTGSATWDKVEASSDNFYVVDIFDIIIDSDGDGIPDAWDKDPSYFDVNVNGVLDGNEIDPALFKTNNRCNDEAGQPYNYQTDPPNLCNNFPVNLTVNDIADFTYLNIDLGTSSPFHNATPFQINRTVNPSQTGLTSIVNIPTVYSMDLYLYDPVGNTAIGEALYYKTTSGNIAVGQTLTRKFPTWHDPSMLGSCTNATGNFNGCKTARRNKKKNSGYLRLNPVYDLVSPTDVSDFVLSSSSELSYLQGGRFSPSNYISPTPPSVW